MTEELLGCDTCGRGEPDKLYADVDGRHFCVTHWRKAGRPYPRRAADPQVTQAAEASARQRMLRRGGADKVNVMKGRT